MYTAGHSESAVAGNVIRPYMCYALWWWTWGAHPAVINGFPLDVGKLTPDQKDLVARVVRKSFSCSATRYLQEIPDWQEDEKADREDRNTEGKSFQDF
ncbi:hypothetical protein TNCV_4956481 [Trichonephila clavipes]|nr:hypothetical protein TNCV_4956481 [Trichonephila clavipes]